MAAKSYASTPPDGKGNMAEPIPAQKAPYAVEVTAGKKYFWCACGRSKSQPFCDGSHKGTGLAPVAWEAPTTKQVFFCGCKSSHKKPFCDGTHNAL
jgi:CDGSH-type Zn-finger protein